jgi:signal transduction histidine kinase
MENLKFKDKIIFANKLLLNFHDQDIQHQFVSKKYDNKTFLFISGTLLLLNIVNTILIFICKYYYSSFKLQVSMYTETIFTICTSGICFFIVLVLYIKGSKNCEALYWILSMTISFMIHCFSILVTVWADYIIGSSTAAFSITFLSFLLFSYNIFFDNSYILSTLERIAIALFFRLYENKTPVSTFELVTTLINNITFSIIVYFAERRDKTLFFIISKFEEEVRRKLEFMEKMSIGLIIYSGESLIYVNEFIKDKIKHEFKAEFLDPYQVENIKSFDELLRNSFFKEIEVINQNILDNIGQRILTFENLMKVIDKIKENQQNFSILGNKTFLNEDKIEISFRYNKEFNYVEFNVKDISLITKVQDYQAKIKYRTLFLSKVAHEFKNPLFSMVELINQLSDKLKQYGDNYSIHKRLLDIRNISNYMFMLIRDFNYLSTSENEMEAEFHNEKFELRKMIEFCVSIFKTRLEFTDKNIELSYEYEDSLPRFIISDELRIKQMLINLLSNSLKFTKFGCIKLIVNHSFEDHQHFIKFCVEDTGIGIPQDKINLITKPFSKLENENNEFGTGLGLNIVSEFTKKLGKDFNILSTFGKGTNISFKILDNTVYNSEAFNVVISDQVYITCKCDNFKKEAEPNKQILDVEVDVSKETVKRNYIVDINNNEIPVFSNSFKENNSYSSNNGMLHLTVDNPKSSIIGLEIEGTNLKSEKKIRFSSNYL